MTGKPGPCVGQMGRSPAIQGAEPTELVGTRSVTSPLQRCDKGMQLVPFGPARRAPGVDRLWWSGGYGLSVQLEDRRTVVLPESVTLDLQIAGVGSRFLSALIDLILLFVLLIVLLIPVIRSGSGVLTALSFVLFFCAFFGFGVYFDTVGGGRSPGKRLAGTRVVRMSDGGAVRGRAAAIRSILRILDQSSLGLVAVLVSPMHQRLGDIAAGTIVIVEPLSLRPSRRERRRHERAARNVYGSPSFPSPVTPGVPMPGVPIPGVTVPGLFPSRALDATSDPNRPWISWDVTAISQQDLTAIRAFLGRRGDLSQEQRQRLAHEFAGRLFEKVAGVDQPPPAETFLEYILEAKQRRSGA
jgi:uncharacterized RDD family membrane protein YckC